MTQEALKQMNLALETMEAAGKRIDELKAENKALKEALAQQEPVKWSDYEPDGMHHNKPQKRPQNCGTGYCSCIECVMETPHRTWVGLTDDEMQALWDRYAHMEMMRAIEAKLKEKNT